MYIFLGIIITIIITLAISSMIFDKKLKDTLEYEFGKPPSDINYYTDSIDGYYIYNSEVTPDENQIDDITWNDLDMNLVYKQINVCNTSVGEEYLYDCLHNISFDTEKLDKREEFISFLNNNPEKRLQIQFYLAKTGVMRYNGLSGFIFDTDKKSLPHPILYRIFALIPLLCAGLMFLSTALGGGLLFLSFVINLVIYYKAKRKIESELSSIKYFLLMLINCKKLCKIKDIADEPVIKELKKYHDKFSSLATAASALVTKDNNNMDFITEYIKILFLYDIRNYTRITQKVKKNSEDFHMLYRTVGEIDMSICILSYRKSLSYFTQPVFNNDNSILFTEIYHPLVKNPVSNSGGIDKNSIITGSNASGKSTFIKSLAINCILAQTINTCTAKSFIIRNSLIMTSMAVRDSIIDGESYFIREIKSLKRILDMIEKVPCTCFIDEILRGTNTIERIAASASVMEYLIDKDCLCIVASHDIELTSMLESKYDNLHFCETVTDDGLFFDYKLKNGVSNTRNAIKLLKHLSFDSDIVKKAESYAKTE